MKENNSKKSQVQPIREEKNEDDIEDHKRFSKIQGSGNKAKPGVSIGKAMRDIQKKVKTVTPGPGSYQASSDKKPSGVSFPQSDKNETLPKLTSLIGPGSYEDKTNNFKTNIPQYSMGSRDASIFEAKKTIPGPADYETSPSKPLTKGKSMSTFGGASRFILSKEKNPGPGDYNNRIKDVKSSSQKGTIPTSKMHPKEPQLSTPGPGQYLKSEEKQEKRIGGKNKEKQNIKGYSMGLKSMYHRSTLPNITTEAFNKYNFKEFIGKTKEKVYSIGRSERDRSKEKQTPSPADYNGASFSVHRAPNAVIPQGRYEKKNQNLRNPGPGSYQISQGNNMGQKYSIPRSHSSLGINRFMDEAPATNYDSKNLTQSKLKKGFLFPKSNRSKFVSGNGTGVGDYNIEISFTIPNSGSGRQSSMQKIQQIQNSKVFINKQ